MYSEILGIEVFKFFVIFSRIGIIFMVMPILSTAFVYSKFRLCAGLMVSIAIYPSVVQLLPVMPNSVLELFLIVLSEVLIGVFFSIFVHIIFAAIEIAGAQTTFSVGFSHSMVFDPFQGQQTMLLNSFLFMSAYAFILVTNLHHLIFQAIFDSYTLFIPGKALMMEDMTLYLIKTLDKSFKIGLEISFPFIILTFAMQTSMAIVAKLMPQLNVLFLAMPAQIYFGMNLLVLLVGFFLMNFVKYYQTSLMNFTAS